MTKPDPIPPADRDRLARQIARLLVYRKGEIAERELKRLDYKAVADLPFDVLMEITAQGAAIVAEDLRLLLADVAREAIEPRKLDPPSGSAQEPPIPSDPKAAGRRSHAPGRDTDPDGGPMPASPYPAMPEPELTPEEQRVADELIADLQRPRLRYALRGEYGPLVTMLTWLGLWAVALLVFIAIVAVIA